MRQNGCVREASKFVAVHIRGKGIPVPASTAVEQVTTQLHCVAALWKSHNIQATVNAKDTNSPADLYQMTVERENRRT